MREKYTERALDRDLTGIWRDDTDWLIQTVVEVEGDRVQAEEDLKVIVDEVTEFLNDLTNPEVYGHAIPLEVRQRAVKLRAFIKIS